jgi:dTDP-4-amino-4,6-dideoxygalactose transaminase
MNNQVEKFEKLLAHFYGAPYAVAVDCCTHAIELCLRIEPIEYTINCPTRTYLSVPMTFEKLGLDWQLDEYDWEDYYYIGCTNIIDAAVYWKRNGYVPGTKMCLSFQFKKHLNLGRGGMILLDNYEEYVTLKKLRYDGRDDDRPWAEQDIDTIGYHYYMTPEIAQTGIYRFASAEVTEPRKWSSKDYPDLSKMKVFNDLLPRT